MTVHVLFVCLGNICRSPTAEGIFRKVVADAGLSERIKIDSAGTGGWHIGKSPDARATAAALQRGYDLSTLRARQVSAIDFGHYDYILAMDEENLRNLEQMKPANYHGELALFLSFARGTKHREVPDPYYGGEAGFTLVLDLIENAAAGLLQHIQPHV